MMTDIETHCSEDVDSGNRKKPLLKWLPQNSYLKRYT